jgi:hypothetical protein
MTPHVLMLQCSLKVLLKLIFAPIETQNCGQKNVFSSPFHGWSHSSTPISLASEAQGSDYLSSELRARVAQPMEVQFTVDDMGEIQGDYYFVRVTQTNDAAAWSSPIWVGSYPSR